MRIAQIAPLTESIPPHRYGGTERVVHWAPNQLRHSAGTEVRHRFGLEAAQVVLGHAHANVTEIYAEKNVQRAAEIMRAIG